MTAGKNPSILPSILETWTPIRLERAEGSRRASTLFCRMFAEMQVNNEVPSLTVTSYANPPTPTMGETAMGFIPTCVH